MSAQPRFDRPSFTVAPEMLDVPVTDQRPLPPLVEPPLPTVEAPSSEPLVRIAHRGIRTLDNYWHAGWERARPGAWLRASVAQRLYAVADALPDGFGLAAFDAYRPLDLQAELFDAAYADPTLPPGFVSEPVADPDAPPPHLTGGTVDLTLVYDHQALALGGGYDDFTGRAHAAALEAEPGAARELRRLLYWSMRAEGFVVLDCEWWHFEHGTRRWAAITGGSPRYGPAPPPPL